MDIDFDAGIVKDCDCGATIWIRYNGSEIVNLYTCPNCTKPHEHLEYEQLPPKKNIFVNARGGKNGLDWQNALPEDWKDFKARFKKRHNNGDNNIAT